jgi:hypothetical protein
MKSSVKVIRIIAAIAVGFVLAVGTNGAFAKTIIRHDGNVVKPPVHDREGKQVNRLPGRSSGAAPKKVKCGINGRSNYSPSFSNETQDREGGRIFPPSLLSG